jgi:hypothetical protein
VQQRLRDASTAVTASAAAHVVTLAQIDAQLMRHLQRTMVEGAMYWANDAEEKATLDALFSSCEAMRKRFGLSVSACEAPPPQVVVPIDIDVGALRAALTADPDVVVPVTPSTGRPLVSAIPAPATHVRKLYDMKAAHCAGSKGVAAREAALAGATVQKGKLGKCPVLKGVVAAVHASKKLLRSAAKMKRKADNNNHAVTTHATAAPAPAIATPVPAAAPVPTTPTLIGDVLYKTREAEIAHSSQRAVTGAHWWEG